MTTICDITDSLEASHCFHYSTYESVMWKLEAHSVQTLRMEFTVKQETDCVLLLNEREIADVKQKKTKKKKDNG